MTRPLPSQIEAAHVVAETMRVLNKSQSNLVAEILHTAPVFEEWAHVPVDDVFDASSGAQYYYHAHPRSSDGRGPHDDEHGHFHLFLNLVDGEDKATRLTHIIGIGMNEFGTPIRLFTTNRWVTGDEWTSADILCSLLDRFVVDDTRPSWPLNLWITHMVQLFKPEIVNLLTERDETIARLANGRPLTEVFEDRDIEVTSIRTIDLMDHVGRLGIDIA